jgi:hypothetical protein
MNFEMKVGLIQVDGKLPNLALMKLATYHKNMGDKLFLMRDNTISKRLVNFDKVYISCIFDSNKKRAIEISKQFKNVEIGGIGMDNKITLPDDIEHLMPDYDLFDCDYSLGFTTRGCIRNCFFCKVPKHEGMIKENCDIYEFWDKRHNEIIIMDNNILALPEHFKKIAKQISDNNLVVDFNQGLDHRLLTPELCDILLKLKHKKEIRFSFDNISYMPTVKKAIAMLKEKGLRIWGTRWYVYISEFDTYDTVYQRMKYLQDERQSVFVMRDKKVYDNPEFMALAEWGNYPAIFKRPELSFKDLKGFHKPFPYVKNLKHIKKDYIQKNID